MLSLMLTSLLAIECPRWLPGTDEMLHSEIALSPQNEIKNLMRCYCEVVKPLEAQCIRQRISPRLCKERTETWLREEVFPRMSRLDNLNSTSQSRGRIISIVP